MTETNNEYETGISDALAELRNAVDVPPLDPTREQALLSAFDKHWIRRGSASHRRTLLSAAALMAITVTLTWFVARNSPRSNSAAVGQAADLSGFAPWPGADAFPPFESGSLIRMDIPVSALPSLGLVAPVWAASVVEADVVVGQDGFARALRLVQ